MKFLQEEWAVGTGPKKKYGRREVNAIERALEKNPRLTCRDLKLKMPKSLNNIYNWTLRRIADINLDRPAREANPH